MKKRSLFNVLIPAIFLAVTPYLALPAQAQETESTVPELSAFHEIIYPIWHTAYPDKDYAALRSYVPEVKRLAEGITAAKLPGILRDKQAKWDQALAELRKSVDAYAAAANGTDDAALLEAAEALHMRYEMMVRTIRPVLREVDEFHKVLYVVYHKYLPARDFAKISETSGDMAIKAEAIAKASLPKRLESKAPAFGAAAQELLAAAKALAETAMSGQGEAIAAAVETVHSKYQGLEKIFD
jgi:predicted lipoprotein